MAILSTDARKASIGPADRLRRGTQSDWLTAKHHFVLGRYDNVDHRSVGVLYVLNDDELAPHSGFPPHRHADVEIITYVRERVITHEDTLPMIALCKSACR